MSDDEKPKPVVINLDDLKGTELPAEKLDALHKELEEARRRFQEPMGDLRRVIEDQKSLLDRMRPTLIDQLRPDPIFQKAMRDLQESSPFNDLRGKAQDFNLQPKIEMKPIEPPRMPPMPKNPILETNKRLGQLENHFTQMLEVMTTAATIGTAIQSHANDFLAKFEKASEDTDKSARSAIRVGVIAILIAILTPLFQMLYAAYQDETEDKLDRLTAELVKLREADSQSNEKLIDALRNADANASSEVISQLRAEGEANRAIFSEIERALQGLKTAPDFIGPTKP